MDGPCLYSCIALLMLGRLTEGLKALMLRLCAHCWKFEIVLLILTLVLTSACILAKAGLTDVSEVCVHDYTQSSWPIPKESIVFLREHLFILIHKMCICHSLPSCQPLLAGERWRRKGSSIKCMSNCTTAVRLPLLLQVFSLV